jgi:transglutaminase-like putative cysteine protease
MTTGLQLRVGYELVFEFAMPTPIIFQLFVHPSRAASLITPDHLHTEPALPLDHFTDAFGNRCARAVAPAGRLRLWTDALVADSGMPDLVVPDATLCPVAALPLETLPYLRASRYCESDRLSDVAWSLFGGTPEDWSRIQAICSWVHDTIRFDYAQARPTKGAWDAYNERTGVCRDFTHLAVAMCRAMNIPARYAAGYLGDIGVPPDPQPMDFSAWFEAWVGGHWHTFDARHNVPRIGRVLLARGRDAADTAMTTTFSPNTLTGFKVWTDAVTGARAVGL